MQMRQDTMAIEKSNLSSYAMLSSETKGRRIEEALCSIRTPFQRDRDRIIHSKSFRRLKHKTQVFLSPEGDHYRTRLTHTLEVSQISRTIARALKLNEDLTEAIALGHDLGHTPFGHCGEEVLNKILKNGFEHNHQSLRVVDYLERSSLKKEGYGLNLTFEVRDGILNHRGPNLPMTLEGQVVKLSDRIAYINHDIDDAIRAGILTIDSFPKEYLDFLGWTHSERVENLIINVLENSDNKDQITMGNKTTYYFNKLREFMFKNVYLDPKAKKEEDKARKVIQILFEYFKENPERMPNDRYADYKKFNDKEVAIKDYIAGMSDRYAVSLYKKIFIPDFWN